MSSVQKLFSLLWQIFFILCVFFLFAGYTFAQSQAGIGIVPATIEKNATPGEIQEHTVKVVNLSGAVQTYYLYTRDIVGVADGGVPVFAEEGEEKTGYELTQWLMLDAQEMTLEPSQEKEVHIKIAVPQEATPGSHFGAVVVSMQPPRLRKTGAAVGYEVANIISIRVAGDAIENAQMRSFSTGNYIYGSAEVDFAARVENKGNVLLRPIGPLEITNMFGKRVAMLTINESKAGVFPLSDRTFSVKWKSENGGFGRYEAVASMVYGSEGRQATISNTTSFWILPMNIIAPALGALLVLLLVTYISIKLYIRSKLRGVAVHSSRLARRRSGGSGFSAFTLVLIVMLAVTSLFLLVLLVLFA
jgi:hypothetical protein